MKKYIIVFVGFILLPSCEKEYTSQNNIRLDPELIIELNSISHDTLIMESDTFVLDAYLWRDFMPVSPPDGRPMASINWLRNIDSTEIPDDFELKEQYVIYGDSIWISRYENVARPVQPVYKIEKITIDGPKWGPEIYVDVISKVHNIRSDSEYYIRKRNVYVERTS